MATAIEKFQAAMNHTSPYWTKNLEVTAQDGEIVTIICEGFCFRSDTFEKKCSEEKK